MTARPRRAGGRNRPLAEPDLFDLMEGDAS